MFRPSDGQATFGSLHILLSPAKQAYLETKHWAVESGGIRGAFRRKALAVLLGCEALFASLFCANNGRPNKPVAQVVGVLLLKEMFDFTDEQAIHAYMFDTSWQYALGVEPDEAHVCQKTLHNFRTAMSEAEAQGESTYSALFDEIVQAIVEDQEIKVGKQRLDSTHIRRDPTGDRRNMAVLTRLQLFTHTITAFLEKLRKQHPQLFAALPAKVTARYVDREGYFADAPSSQGRRRLAQSDSAESACGRLVAAGGSVPRTSQRFGHGKLRAVRAVAGGPVCGGRHATRRPGRRRSRQRAGAREGSQNRTDRADFAARQ